MTTPSQQRRAVRAHQRLIEARLEQAMFAKAVVLTASECGEQLELFAAAEAAPTGSVDPSSSAA